MDSVGAVVSVSKDARNQRRVNTEFAPLFDINAYDGLGITEIVSRGRDTSTGQIVGLKDRDAVFINSFSYFSGAELFDRLVGIDDADEMVKFSRVDVDLSCFKSIARNIAFSNYDILAIGVEIDYPDTYALMLVRTVLDDGAKKYLYKVRYSDITSVYAVFMRINSLNLEAGGRDLFDALFSPTNSVF